MEKNKSISDGMSHDASGEPLADPTKNVLDLVHAAVNRLDDLAVAANKRQDDLRAAELVRHNDMLAAESRRNEDLRKSNQFLDTTIHGFQTQLSVLRVDAVKATIDGQKEIIRLLRDSTISNAAITRSEHDRLVAELAAYKLEVSQTIAAKQLSEVGKAQGAESYRIDSRASMTTIVAIAVGAGTLLNILFNAYTSSSTRAAAAAPQVVYAQPQLQAQVPFSIPPGYVLVPSTQRPTSDR